MSSCPAPRSHYTTLGVPPEALQADIKAAYLKLMLLVHPDKLKHSAPPSDAPPLESVVQAYQTLSDSALRKDYDAELERLTQQQRRAADRSVEFTTVKLSELRLMDDEEEQREHGIIEEGEDGEEEVFAYDCRCGDIITVYADDLSDSAPDENSVVSCETCSLSIKVV